MDATQSAVINGIVGIYAGDTKLAEVGYRNLARLTGMSVPEVRQKYRMAKCFMEDLVGLIDKYESEGVSLSDIETILRTEADGVQSRTMNA